MTKTALCLTALLLATSAYAGDSRVHTTRDSGSYEVNLRDAGVPISSGLAWTAPHGGTSTGEPAHVVATPAKGVPERHLATTVSCPPGCRS